MTSVCLSFKDLHSSFHGGGPQLLPFSRNSLSFADETNFLGNVGMVKPSPVSENIFVLLLTLACSLVFMIRIIVFGI